MVVVLLVSLSVVLLVALIMAAASRPPRDSRYRPGTRSDKWLRLAAHHRKRARPLPPPPPAPDDDPEFLARLRRRPPDLPA